MTCLTLPPSLLLLCQLAAGLSCAHGRFVSPFGMLAFSTYPQRDQVGLQAEDQPTGKQAVMLYFDASNCTCYHCTSSEQPSLALSHSPFLTFLQLYILLLRVCSHPDSCHALF
jgi:hypothetical protein